MEAENAKLKAKLERVKSTRKAEEKKAMATKKAAGGGGTDDEIDEIERLRRENEELRRLAEERIRVLTARQQAEEAEEEADQEEVEAALEDERPAEEPAPEPVEAAAEEPQEEVEEVAPEPELEPEPEPEPVVAASTDLDTVDEAGLCEGKAHCLYFTYPETPQAGEDCLVFLNRASSGVLRDRPQVKLLLSFNGWEVPGDAYALSITMVCDGEEDEVKKKYDVRHVRFLSDQLAVFLKDHEGFNKKLNKLIAKNDEKSAGFATLTVGMVSFYNEHDVFHDDYGSMLARFGALLVRRAFLRRPLKLLPTLAVVPFAATVALVVAAFRTPAEPSE